MPGAVIGTTGVAAFLRSTPAAIRRSPPASVSGLSGGGGGGGASVAAKTEELGRYDTKPEEEQEAERRDGLSTAAGAAASPGATTHGPAAEALLDEVEYDAETIDAAGASVNLRSSDVCYSCLLGPLQRCGEWPVGTKSA